MDGLPTEEGEPQITVSRSLQAFTEKLEGSQHPGHPNTLASVEISGSALGFFESLLLNYLRFVGLEIRLCSRDREPWGWASGPHRQQLGPQEKACRFVRVGPPRLEVVQTKVDAQQPQQQRLLRVQPAPQPLQLLLGQPEAEPPLQRRRVQGFPPLADLLSSSWI